jgi:hypothetical protein
MTATSVDGPLYTADVSAYLTLNLVPLTARNALGV